MSRSAISARGFAIYVFIVGAVLVIAPNALLSLFRLPETSEIWIRIIGVLAFNIGVFAWVSAENNHFLRASVLTRILFFIAITTFAAVGLASPVIILFGIADLVGALWTYFALKADDNQRRPLMAG